MPFDRIFLDELSARNDIVDIVSQYVHLKKSGANYFGLCPFHNEKTGSFSVSPDKQIFHCFGCGAGGGVITFVMKAEGLSFPDAVRYLADRAGMQIPEQGEAERKAARHRERLYALCRDAGRFYYDTLWRPENRVPQQYFINRGLSRRTMNRFGLGYAPDSFHALIDAMTAKGYTRDELMDAGLVSRSEKGHVYDRFRNRLMFPIIDIRGNVIGFGGRVMDNSTPKYLNSPETSIFNKRKNLFALNLAKKTKMGFLILVEGYMDAIALHQYGFDCAVASLGTSLTEEHAALLSRYTEQVVLIYDGDEAGQNATKRAIPMLEKAGLQVKVLQMRDAKDPDEYLKKFGAARFKILLEESSNRVEYQLRAIQKKYDLREDDQKIQFITEAAELISTLGNAVSREIYGTRVAEAAGITPESMKIEVDKAFRRRIAREKKKQEKIDLSPAMALQPKDRSIRYDNIRSAMAEESLIAMVLREPALLSACRNLTVDCFSSPLLGRVFDQLCQCMAMGNEPSLASLTDFTSEEMAHIASVLQRHDGPVSEQGLNDCIRTILVEHQSAHAANTNDDLLAFQHQMLARKGLRT